MWASGERPPVQPRKQNTMSTIKESLDSALNTALEGVNPETHSGLWDATASFAASVGMPFPVALREAVLTAAGVVAGRNVRTVTVRGGASKTVSSRNLREAMVEVVAHHERKGATKEAMKSLRTAFGQVVAVNRLMGALGSTRFEIEA